MAFCWRGGTKRGGLGGLGEGSGQLEVLPSTVPSPRTMSLMPSRYGGRGAPSPPSPSGERGPQGRMRVRNGRNSCFGRTLTPPPLLGALGIRGRGAQALVGREGFEPSTNGLKVHCSTAELTAPSLSIPLSRKARRSLLLSPRERARGEGHVATVSNEASPDDSPSPPGRGQCVRATPRAFKRSPASPLHRPLPCKARNSHGARSLAAYPTQR